MSLRHRRATIRFRDRGRPIAAAQQPPNSGGRRLAFITIAVFLTALSSSRVSNAESKQPCSEAMPSKAQGHWWSYRIIDGRKCWYEGKPGLSKSLLQWPQETPAQLAPEAVTRTAPEQPRERARAPNAQSPMDAETFRERWRAGRLIEDGALSEEAAAITDRPVTPDDDSKPPLSKADRLPLPSLSGRQPRAIGTLVIAPNPPGPALGQK
jgi:hypothetical protein